MRRFVPATTRASSFARSRPSLVLAFGLAALAACADDVDDPFVAGDAGRDPGADGVADFDVLDAADPFESCPTLDNACLADPSAPCDRLFGEPTERTGLTAEQCAPACSCDGRPWSPPTYDEPFIADLRSRVLENPPEPLTYNPYETPDEVVEEPDAVCGVVLDAEDPSRYRLETFATVQAAQEATARVTHFGACGLCSTLSDLAVYIENPDLTGPVQECTFLGLREGEEAQLECLMDLGFAAPCADIWAANATHTRTVCFEPCARLLDASYHESDGSLNDCLACDEELSGTVFAAVAGRTRRNTGLVTALCRPCNEVQPLVHAY